MSERNMPEVKAGAPTDETQLRACAAAQMEKAPLGACLCRLTEARKSPPKGRVQSEPQPGISSRTGALRDRTREPGPAEHQASSWQCPSSTCGAFLSDNSTRVPRMLGTISSGLGRQGQPPPVPRTPQSNRHHGPQKGVSEGRDQAVVAPAGCGVGTRWWKKRDDPSLVFVDVGCR